MSVTQLRETERTETAPRLRRRRSSRLVLVAVVLAVLGALAGAYAYTSATGRIDVVAVARDLPVGATLAPEDVRRLRVPEDTGLATVGWEQLDTVVGRVTTTGLSAGQILTPESVTDMRIPAPGEAVVGVSVEQGRAPAAELNPGDQVLVITGAGAPPQRASVVSAGGPDVSGRRGIDLLVPQAAAEDLALAAVEDKVAIVLVGRG